MFFSGRRRVPVLALVLWLCVPCILEAADAGTWPGFKERFISAEGRVIDRFQQEISHSEGQGYAMLLAVAANDREAFSHLWQWTRVHLQVRSTDALCAWSWGKRANGELAPIDFNNATDGDICIAWALFLAREQWNVPAYEDEGNRLLASISDHLLVERYGRTLMLPGYYGFTSPDSLVLNPSYWVLPAFRVFGRFSDPVLWDRVYENGLQLLKENSYGRWKLPPDWMLLKQEGSAIFADKPPLFGYEALRVLLWASWDNSLEKVPGVTKLLDLIASSGELPMTIDLVKNQLSEQEASAGGLAIVALCAERLGRGKQAADLWQRAARKIGTEDGDYYSRVLYLLARSRSGNE